MEDIMTVIPFTNLTKTKTPLFIPDHSVILCLGLVGTSKNFTVVLIIFICFSIVYYQVSKWQELAIAIYINTIQVVILKITPMIEEGEYIRTE